MAAPSNPSFEDIGTSRGEADSWTSSRSDSGTDVAIFSDGPRQRPYEGFVGGWDDCQDAQLSLGASDVVAALFEAVTYEGFENSWRLPSASGANFNHQSAWIYDAGNFSAAEFDAANDEHEDFEEEWDDNEDAQSSLAPGDVTAASFDDYPTKTPEDVEDFEEVWQDNEDAQSALTAPDVTSALFDAGANGHEDFEGTWTSTLP